MSRGTDPRAFRPWGGQGCSPLMWLRPPKGLGSLSRSLTPIYMGRGWGLGSRGREGRGETELSQSRRLALHPPTFLGTRQASDAGAGERFLGPSAPQGASKLRLKTASWRAMEQRGLKVSAEGRGGEPRAASRPPPL